LCRKGSAAGRERRVGGGHGCSKSSRPGNHGDAAPGQWLARCSAAEGSAVADRQASTLVPTAFQTAFQTIDLGRFHDRTPPGVRGTGAAQDLHLHTRTTPASTPGTREPYGAPLYFPGFTARRAHKSFFPISGTGDDPRPGPPVGRTNGPQRCIAWHRPFQHPAARMGHRRALPQAPSRRETILDFFPRTTTPDELGDRYSIRDVFWPGLHLAHGTRSFLGSPSTSPRARSAWARSRRNQADGPGRSRGSLGEGQAKPSDSGPPKISAVHARSGRGAEHREPRFTALFLGVLCVVFLDIRSGVLARLPDGSSWFSVRLGRDMKPGKTNQGKGGAG